MSDTHFLRQVYAIAAKSPHPDTQVGALLVHNGVASCIAEACNDIPRGLKVTEARLSKSLRSDYFKHAESACLLKGLGVVYDLEDLTLYCTWAACKFCALDIVVSGVRRVVYHKAPFQATNSHWTESVELGLSMLREAGVQLVEVAEKLDAVPIRFGGQVVHP